MMVLGDPNLNQNYRHRLRHPQISSYNLPFSTPGLLAPVQIMVYSPIESQTPKPHHTTEASVSWKGPRNAKSTMIWMSFSLTGTLTFLLVAIQVVTGEIRPFDLRLEPAVRANIIPMYGPNSTCQLWFLLFLCKIAPNIS
jgi:hypothetical protein